LESLATLFTDLPLSKQRFHGLLQDLAASRVVGTITPFDSLAEHCFQDSPQANSDCSIQVVVNNRSGIPATVLSRLHKVGFRPAHALEFRAVADSCAQANLWPLLQAYAGELQGWVLTSTLDFEDTLVRVGTEDEIFSISSAGDGLAKAVLISSRTMKQLAP
jgi:hypothetical protein